MKLHTRACVVVALACMFAMLPAMAAAQTAGTSGFASSTYNRGLYWDGSSQSTSTRMQQIRQYRQQSSDLQQKIAALPTVATASILMPVLFGVEVKDISPNFGDPRDGGTRTHEGEDIMAVKGTPVVSPTGAVVLRTVTGVDEGNAVYTANPGGETFVYIHLDRFGEGVVAGAVLQQGSLIGYVGNTGNASGGPAHLHFEIHSSSGTPTDPFPRLTSEFSIQEKISYLSTILVQSSDKVALAQLLVINFRGIFIAALAANISLPLPIIEALASVPATPTSTGGTSVLLPAGDLDIGSSGALVVQLQQYLIQTAAGVAALQLKSAGATGYFGIITKAALVEYQVTVGIAPPSGYYGATTRAFIAAHPLGTTSPSGSGTAAFTRDLYYGVSGSDVQALQQWLNAHGYTVAASGAGSAGNESLYFGSATQAAVIRLQLARGIAPAAGYVGPLTRSVLTAL